MPIYLGGTGSANELDDYETGSWTPLIDGSSSVSGQSYSAQVGVYTKIGNMVQVNCNVKLSAKGTIVGVLRVSGLPFLPDSSPNSIPAANSIEHANITDGHVFYAEQYGGNAFLYLKESDNSEDEAQTQLYTANINNDTEIRISLTYRTAA